MFLNRFKKNTLEIVVFLSGSSLMILEIVGSRVAVVGDFTADDGLSVSDLGREGAHVYVFAAPLVVSVAS